MNRSRVLVLSLSVIVAMLWLSFAKAIPAGDDWLPVPPEDLALNDNPASPGANAMILYRRSHVNAQRAAIDGAEDDEYIRIKIFTEAGVKRRPIQQFDFSRKNPIYKTSALAPSGRTGVSSILMEKFTRKSSKEPVRAVT